MFSLRALTTIIASSAALFSLTRASPSVERRDVWVPQILYPRANIVWKTGYRHNVTWDTSSQPEQITNPVGSIQLRRSGSTFPDVLQSGFQLTDGRVEITVPDVTPGCGYQIVLFGDSGNFSPEFIIASEGD
ncbi:hypothetical protein ACEPAH_9009 [Sanghuangporus vaninii]